ncbi:MAG TPA: hypothetical protein VJ377_10205 [Dehalococcoidales bacterium]|nr:MAG: hypothetical protein A2Z05_02125 [Chloroflexi bacterium RBG_16_60_22]HJX13878.1 hypothetical protein [Dehalococcoidales bacterium]
MTGTKYGKLIQEAPFARDRLGLVAHLYGGEHFGGTCFSPAWVGITAPLFMMEKSHVHDYDEYLFFFGGDMADVTEFAAEVELCLGEEEEKHVITRPCVVYVPRGLAHCPLNFKVVRKPVMFMDISISPAYGRQ